MSRHRREFSSEPISSAKAIDLVIDAVLTGSKPLRKLTKDVLKAQKKLRSAVDDEGWKDYLKLEEVVNERASMQMELLVRWALASAARSRR